MEAGYNNNIADAAERRASLDPSASFIVQAPAGSGKTELLMQRYLTLLCLVESPEEILAVTFTKKAASGMQRRVMDALNEAAGRPAPGARPQRADTLGMARRVLDRDRVKGWNILQNPGRLKVQTIDSFSSYLTRQMPLASRIGLGESVSEDAADLYIEAARRTVDMIDDESAGECVRSALRHMDNSVKALTERLSAMLERREQWLRHVGGDINDAALKERLECGFKRVVEDELKSVVEAFPAASGVRLIPFARFAADNIEDEKESEINALSNLAVMPGASSENLYEWRGIRKLLLTDKNTWRKSVDVRLGFPADKDKKGLASEMKKGIKDLIDELRGEDALLEGLSRIQSLPDPQYTDEDWEALSSLMRLLPISCAHLNAVFSESGCRDFQSVSMAALAALGTDEEPTDLMLSIDMKLRHILVDEYQDTSRMQLDLLRALTRGWEEGDGRTLFVVGDPMQSIYLFREAEVGLFLDAQKNGIGTVSLQPVTLKCNFRSDKNIVDWVNASFDGAFPQVENIAEGAVKYAPSAAVNDGSPSSGVSLLLYPERNDAGEAARIIEIISCIDKGESVAVLCGSRPHLNDVVGLLNKNAIDFRADKFDPIIDSPVIHDLFAVTRALLHPFDRVAWLAILRAPWCGAPLGDILKICAGDKPSPVLKLAEDAERLSSLTEDGRRRILSTMDKVRRAYELTGRCAMRNLIEGLWIDLSGPACVRTDEAMKDAETFLDLVSFLEAGRGVTIESLLRGIKRLYANHPGGIGTNVNIMTVHGAKGLEFDHVIVPGLGKYLRNEDKKILIWLESGDDILLAPVEKRSGKSAYRDKPNLYKYLSDLKKKKRDLEKTRLLYVASTRAVKRLHLFGHANVNPDEIKPDGRSFLTSIRHVIARDMIVSDAAALVEAAPAPSVLRLKRLPTDWQPPMAAASVQAARSTEVVETDERPEFNWAGEEARHLGTVVHECLSIVASDGVDAWTASRISAAKKRIVAMLRSQGIRVERAAALADGAAAILNAAMRDERGRWILSLHKEAGVEYEITGVIDNEIIHARIDRTFVDEKGVRWIVDYKTGAHEGGSVEGFLAAEKLRYMHQLERYAELLKNSGETREIRKGLYYPAIPGWVEW